MSTKIESTAIIEPGAFIGTNCYIGHFTVIRPGAVIDDYAEIRAHCFIAANAEIGYHTQIMQFSNICRNCIVEGKVFVGMGCITTNTKRIAFLRKYEDINTPPTIKYGSRIGAGVTILPGITIEENCVIGAGSVVTKDTTKNGIYIGNPAKYIKDIKGDEII